MWYVIIRCSARSNFLFHFNLFKHILQEVQHDFYFMTLHFLDMLQLHGYIFNWSSVLLCLVLHVHVVCVVDQSYS